ncbi:hypothetical protein ALC62_13891 [Cyphomyrmex costatus]|uniref:Uncharacterized protein n=1 Tax=Cyphomyrmex costatus TaxID=456900 RepID=A0A195C5L4_9HYME|nr:hypothetical protein ALC62_13891 [Cyphomyrmex costatus]
MPTAGPFKVILAKGTGDLVDSATGFTNVFVANIFLVFDLTKSQWKPRGRIIDEEGRVKLGHNRHDREFSKHQTLKRSKLPY